MQIDRVEPKVEFTSFRWSAVLAGAFMAIAVWIVLHLVGLGLGVSAADLTDPAALRTLGIGSGVLALVAPLVALFIGGVVAARVAGPITRVVAALHGAVLWAMATIFAGIGVVALVASLAGGLDRVMTRPMDRRSVAQGIAASAPVDATQAQELAQKIEHGIDEMGKAAAVVHTAEDGGAVFLVAGAGLLIGLLSAMLGASIGVSRRQVRAAHATRAPLGSTPSPA